MSFSLHFIKRVSVPSLVVALSVGISLFATGCSSPENDAALVSASASGSTGSAEQPSPEDYGLRAYANVNGVILPVHPGWRKSDLGNMGTVFSDVLLTEETASLDGETAIFVRAPLSLGSSDYMRDRLEAIGSSTGWDIPAAGRFEETDAWDSDGCSFSLSRYGSDYGIVYLMLLGEADNGNGFAVFARTSGDSNLIDAVLRNVTYEAQPAQVDKSGLRDALNIFTFEQQDYYEQGWSDYVEARAAAEAVLADGSATQESVDNATRALRFSSEILVPKPDSGLYQKFTYDWYMENNYHREGAHVGAAGMVTTTFRDDSNRYLVVTLANDDATLSDNDVLIMPSSRDDLESYAVGDVLAIFGTTYQIQVVSTSDGYSGNLPAIIAVEIRVAE
ncbi:hypothetical protein [Collinsella ihumii]|uniref:hypothetical protein n=1 Tax=Collinsella ihumii TaxID=1720204 RepID=UPI0025AA9AC1|nr:hypothetical protein [Collinsella ihumii]MDN0056350.1 hypothetical protein [Collinsella ihumii]